MLASDHSERQREETTVSPNPPIPQRPPRVRRGRPTRAQNKLRNVIGSDRVNYANLCLTAAQTSREALPETFADAVEFSVFVIWGKSPGKYVKTQ